MIRRLVKLESRRWTSEGPQDLRNNGVVSPPTTGCWRFQQLRTTKRHKKKQKQKQQGKPAFTGQRTSKGKAQERSRGEPQWLPMTEHWQAFWSTCSRGAVRVEAGPPAAQLVQLQEQRQLCLLALHLVALKDPAASVLHLQLSPWRQWPNPTR